MHENKVVTTSRVEIMGDGTEWTGRLWLYNVDQETNKPFPDAALFMDKGLLKFQLYGQELIGGTEGIMTGGPLLSSSLELRHDGTLLLQSGAKLATHDINGLGRPYANPLIGRDDAGVCQIGTSYGPSEISASKNIKVNIAGQSGELYSTINPPAALASNLTDEEVAELDNHTRKAYHLRIASEAIAPLQDAIDLEIATEEEKAQLMELKKHRVALHRLDLTADEIVWPSFPIAKK